MPSTQHSIELTDITKSFGHGNVVDGVSFTVDPGEIFGLIGPNGAGKTTTIRMMMDIIRPDTGRIAVLGSGFPGDQLPSATVGDQPARTLFASPSKIVLAIPGDLEGGRTPVRLRDLPGETVFVTIGAAWATTNSAGRVPSRKADQSSRPADRARAVGPEVAWRSPALVGSPPAARSPRASCTREPRPAV